MKSLCLLILLAPQLVMASALVIRDSEKSELRVIARLHYYGEAATEEIAEASTQEIINMWSEPDSEVFLPEKGTEPSIFGRSNTTGLKAYRVKFEIDYVLHKEKPQVNLSCAHNLIEIRNATSKSDFSHYTAIGSREAIFFTDDDLGNSTTAAHEFGHALALRHPHENQRTAKVPGIMFARGTIVRPEFQIDPKVSYRDKSGQGRLNPYLRKVRVQDIKAIDFSRSWYTPTTGCLGKGNPILL